ncbi:MAG: transketolase [Nitrospirae bacterium]|nr:MAG: transketolase [Nitrospirota bacterium]
MPPTGLTAGTPLATLNHLAARLRILSVRSTTEAGSGHPTSCCSAADIVAVLFFSVMRFNPKNPKHPNNDRFVLSKGHAAPLLYAAWAEAGAFNPDDLLRLRTLESDLEGHPTPRLNFVDVATGSLGQGLNAGIGLALNARLDQSNYRTYVLMGDGESMEGSIWEAAEIARHLKLDNLCAIVDVNRQGQSDPTILQHDMEAYRARWSAFGWNALVVDGHDTAALLNAFEQAGQTKGKPTVLLARTLKGKGISFAEDKPDWHGKAFKKGEEADKALAELSARLLPSPPKVEIRLPDPPAKAPAAARPVAPPEYQPSDSVATREAFGATLVKLGEANPKVVALDADVKNSTFTDKFGKKFPDRFFETFIAEQNMIGAGVGLASQGKIPFVATFAAFLTRAYDFIRMAAISKTNLKLMGSHVGVSIGEDGPSQMGLEDLAMMAAQPGVAVLYPSDAVCTHWLTALAADHQGMVYIRTGRPKTPILYKNDEQFTIGGSKVLRESAKDKLTVVAAGVTLFEALKAHDELAKQGIAIRVVDLYSIVPIDRATLLASARATNNLMLTVEDHYAHGGIGDAVTAAVNADGVKVHKMAVTEIPHSGKPDQLLDRYGLSARHIVEKVKKLIS